MGFPVISNTPGLKMHHVRLLGANGADPTKELGNGITVTRTGEGVYRLTWAQNPGTFVGMVGTFGAATPGDVKGMTVTRDTFTAATSTASAYLDISTWDSTFAADDIIATEYLDLVIMFKTSGA